MDETRQLTLTPIGVMRSGMRLKYDAPSQPENSTEERNTIELSAGWDFEKALRDLHGFDRIWLIWWFDKNSTWRPLVLPPRGPAVRRGVFATRSPHRPNPIGLTSVPLIEVRRRSLIVGNTDLLDGTPILDIKPYIRTVDSFPEAKLGWLEEVEALEAMPPRFKLVESVLAVEQFEWLLRNWQLDFRERAYKILARNPEPHRTRRITRTAAGGYRIGCGAWRIFFSVDGDQVSIARLAPGFPLRLLKDPGYEQVPDREAQLAFEQIWPSDS